MLWVNWLNSVNPTTYLSLITISYVKFVLPSEVCDNVLPKEYKVQCGHLESIDAKGDRDIFNIQCAQDGDIAKNDWDHPHGYERYYKQMCISESHVQVERKAEATSGTQHAKVLESV